MAFVLSVVVAPRDLIDLSQRPGQRPGQLPAELPLWPASLPGPQIPDNHLGQLNSQRKTPLTRNHMFYNSMSVQLALSII